MELSPPVTTGYQIPPTSRRGSRRMALIQLMMRAKVLSSSELVRVFERIYALEQSEEEQEQEQVIDYEAELQNYLTGLNNDLHEVGYMIKKYRKNNELHYAFINLKSDEISKTTTLYSPREMQVINKLIEAIYRAPNQIITKENAFTVMAETAGGTWSKTDSLTLLKELVRDKWLTSDHLQREFGLSIRLLAELGDTLKNQYDEEE